MGWAAWREGTVPGTRHEKEFKVDRHGFHTIGRAGHYITFFWMDGCGNKKVLSSTTFHTMYILTSSIHAWRRGSGIQVADTVGMENFTFTGSHFDGICNVINIVGRLESGEGLYYVSTAEEGIRMVRSGQKIIPLLCEIISRFSKPAGFYRKDLPQYHHGDIARHLFYRTGSTSVACLNLINGLMRTFVWPEIDASWFNLANWNLVTRFADVLLQETRSTIQFRVLHSEEIISACEPILSYLSTPFNTYISNRPLSTHTYRKSITGILLLKLIRRVFL